MLPLRMLGLLMLLLLHGADSTSCPPDVDLVIQHPLIGEYGSTVMVNCTSTTWEREGITLLVGDRSTGNEVGRNSTNYLVQLTDWNTKVICKIQLNNSAECIKEAEITAYKNPEVALYVDTIDDTQYKLQCDVTNFAPAQDLTVTWFRDGEILTTNSSALLSKEAVNDSFTLVVNVNRAEKDVPFRCQAQLDLGPHTPLNPVTSQTHNVSAFYAPELTTTYSDNITVSQGENVTLTCVLEGNPPSDFQWTVDGEDLTENTNQLKITEVTKSAVYICTATNDRGNKSVKIDVHVMEVTTGAPASVAITTLEAQTQAPQGCALVLTPPEIMVRFGDPVEVNCTSNTPIALIGWEAPAGGKSLMDATALTWKIEKLELWDIKPLCNAILTADGTQCEKKLNVTVYQTPDVSISAMVQGPMTEGREHQLKCDIINVAPVQLKVKWYHRNETVFTEDIQENNTTPTNVSSYYTVIPERGDNGSVFRCEAELQLGPKGPEFLLPETSDPFTAVVYYKPVFKDFPSNYSVAEGNFTLSELTYETDGNPPPTVNWYFRGNAIDPHKLLSRNESGNYVAEAGNRIGKTNTSVHITVEYGPSLTCEDQYEVKENSEFENPCKLAGLPPPSVTWFKHEKEISLTHWTKHDSGIYTLDATNKHGADQQQFNLQVLYKPFFKNFPSHFSGREGNFTLSELTYETDGNPPPTVNWYFRGKPIDPQKSLSRIESGNYVAEAGNRIGKTNTSVHITVEYGPSLTCEDQYEVEANSELRNPCKLDGSPHPSVTWSKHEKMFSLTHWTKHDSGIYTLNATNKHGAVQHQFNLQVLYAPDIVDENATIEITPGQNVTLNCSADGNPTPEIAWTSTGSTKPTVTTGERYSIITITEATSLSTGVYQCVATNKIGYATRKVTITFVRTDSSPRWILPVAVTAAVLLIIVAILYVSRACKKKGHYSFVVNSDASNIPMIAKSANGNSNAL